MGRQDNLDVNAEPSSVKRVSATLSFQMGVGIALFLALIFASMIFVIQTRGRDVFVEQAHTLNQGVGQNIILKFRERLSRAESIARSMANVGLSLPKDPTVYNTVVPELLTQTGMDDLVAGGGIWPEPYKFNSDTERRSFFWGKDSSGKLQSFDDYNDPNGSGYHHEEWYVPALFLSKGEVYWSKSYMDPYSLEPMVTCTVPMWNGDEIVGVATIDLKLLGLSEFMAEQTDVIKGYAFAVDRNKRLLSTPTTPAWNTFIVGMLSPERADYPTLAELASAKPELKAFVDDLSHGAHWQRGLASDADADRLKSLSQKLADQSYQLELDEAHLVAHQLISHAGQEVSVDQIDFEYDALMGEGSSVNVFSLSDIGWSVVVAMPSRYANEAVSRMTNQMVGLMLVLLILSAAVFVSFLGRSFMKPVKQLTVQVRGLIRRKDYDTHLDLRGDNEIAELARCFNVRSEQLRDVLGQLTDQNIALEEARRDAESANEGKSIFLASMSHEIRTPMNAIIGMTELLGRMPLETEQASYVKTINSSSQSLLSLVNDIMDYSKVEAGKLELEHIPFDLRATLDDCADLISFQCEEKNIDFVYFVSPKVPQKVIGDPGRMRQIVLNLLGNAVKFTTQGYVELWVDCNANRGDGIALSLRVRDTGIGIPLDKQSQLFSPFQQGDSSTTREYGGTGLGLTISKRLAELMSGDIQFESQPGVGTAFSFDVFLDVSQDTRAFLPFVQAQRYHFIALVSDDEQRRVVESYAVSMGYHFRVVSSAEKWLSALALLHDQPVISLVWELSLLGDFSLLCKTTPATTERHKLLVVSSVHTQATVDVSILEQVFRIEFVAMPIKFNHFVSAIKDLMEGQISTSCSRVVPGAPERKNTREGEAKDFLSSGGAKPSGDFAHFSDKKILVAEDNKVNRQIMTLQLHALGLVADTVNDGLEALRAAQRKDYDVILMDWQMPRMDGLEATRKIREMDGQHEPIVIAVTANAMSGDVETCLEAGMNDYISKPVRSDELSAKLAKWLSVDLIKQ